MRLLRGYQAPPLTYAAALMLTLSPFVVLRVWQEVRAWRARQE